ncbi:MAG TPA: ornithine carbamoyltransferase [Thermoprotei archaeon]|nr:ornithine carbamoyltransferase [Thermoprotei archaeon]
MMHFLSLLDFSRDIIYKIITYTENIKGGSINVEGILEGKIMGMIFEKPSTRTRVSFEVAMKQLGGDAIYLPTSTLQLSRGESLKDTAKVLSRYLDILMARVYKHETLEELAKYSDIPVINGLSDLEHPVQIVSDFYTIYEYFGKLHRIKISYVGDGNNNVARSLAIGCALLGIDLAMASPREYTISESFLRELFNRIPGSEKYISIYQDPYDAVVGADVIYTDTFISMGMESETEERLRIFLPKYQVTMDLLNSTGKDTVFMHCLPAHRGHEVTDEVIDSENSIVYDQAENRLHTQKTIILYLLGYL